MSFVASFAFATRVPPDDEVVFFVGFGVGVDFTATDVFFGDVPVAAVGVDVGGGAVGVDACEAAAVIVGAALAGAACEAMATAVGDALDAGVAESVRCTE